MDCSWILSQVILQFKGNSCQTPVLSHIPYIAPSLEQKLFQTIFFYIEMEPAQNVNGTCTSTPEKRHQPLKHIDWDRHSLDFRKLNQGTECAQLKCVLICKRSEKLHP